MPTKETVIELIRLMATLWRFPTKDLKTTAAAYHMALRGPERRSGQGCGNGALERVGEILRAEAGGHHFNGKEHQTQAGATATNGFAATTTEQPSGKSADEKTYDWDEELDCEW